MTSYGPVHRPRHYVAMVDGNPVECADIIDALQMEYHRGQAFKYLWRAGHKDPDKYVEDLRKAIWYLERLAAIIDRQQHVADPQAVTGPLDRPPSTTASSGKGPA